MKWFLGVRQYGVLAQGEMEALCAAKPANPSSALTLIAHSRLAYYVRAFPLLAQRRSRLDAIGRPLPTIELTEWMLTQSRS
jgi:hypothetical protein